MPLKQLQDILLGASIPILRDSPLPSVQSPAKVDKFMFKWMRKKDKAIEQFCKIIETKEFGQDLKVHEVPKIQHVLVQYHAIV